MPRKKISKKESKLTINVFEYYRYLAGKQDTEKIKFKKPDWLLKAKEITENLFSFIRIYYFLCYCIYFNLIILSSYLINSFTFRVVFMVGLFDGLRSFEFKKEEKNVYIELSNYISKYLS